MNIRDIAKKVGSYISSKTQDDEGFIRQGKFTPIKQVKQTTKNVGNYFNPTSNAGQNFWSTPVAKGLSNIQQSIPNPVKTFSQGFGNTSTYGLVGFKPENKDLAYRAGQVAGFVNPFNPLNKGMAALNVGSKVVSKLAPTIAPKLAGKIIGGLGSEALQTGAYAGASALGSKLGLNEQTDQFTPQNLATNLALGGALRGGLGIIGKQGVGNVKGMLKTPKIIDEKTAAEIGRLVDKSKTDFMIKNTDPKQTADMMIDNQALKDIDNLISRFIGKVPKNMTYTDKVKLLEETVNNQNIPNFLNMGIVGNKPIKTEGETIKIKPNEDLVKQFDETIKIKPSTSKLDITQPELKQRGFSASVQEAPDISKKTKIKVLGGYETKPNEQLMGEAKALLTEGGTIKDVKNIPDIDRKVTAAMQEALNLDAAGKHDEAAALFNNLSDIGTELGRGVQAYSLLQKMSPQAISLSAAGQIKKYNRTAKVKLPELTGEQQKLISGQVEAIRNMVDGKEKNIALNQLKQTINSFIPSGKADKFITVWKAGLLTSLRTHARNIVGNTMMQGGEITSQAPAGVADYLMSLRTGQRTISPTLKGTVSGAKEGLDQFIDIMKYGFDPSEEISKFDVKKITWKNTPTDQALKKYTDFVFNTLSAEDKPFWQSSYSRSLYNQAGAEAINQGKKGNTKFIQNLVNNASEEMKNQATIDANYATFKDKNMISNVASNFKRVMGNKWYGKLSSEIVAPFTGVPSSMLTKTFDYSPLGLIRGIKDAGKVITQNVPDLQRQAAQEIGRGTIGTAIFGLGAYLAGKGLITGQPKDDAERKQWELEGKQANSILVNGKWRSINSVGPQAIILLAGAKADEELNDPEGNIGKYGLSLVQDQLNQTFLSGVQQPLQAITDPNRYGKSYVGGQISSLTPNIVKDFSKAIDPTQREVDTGTMGGNIKTSIQSGVPIWRNQMTPKRDTLGNILKQEPTGLGAFVDLFNSKTPISNNVVDELSRLNESGYNATPSKIQKSQTINGTKVVLDQKSLDQYEEEAGKAVSTALETLFNSNSYQKLDDESKQEAIDKLVTAERKKVRANIDLKYMPDTGYVKSTDAPTSLGGKISVYGKSVITDPGQTIKAVIAGNPIRKVEGGAVILERKNSLGTLDKGNTSTQVDHKIALTLGGSNDESNLQVLTNEENQIKGQFETYLYKEMKAGRITKEEAQKKDLNWREEVNKLPKAEQTKIANSLKDEAIDETSGNVYKLVSEAGTVTTIDLDKEIEEPKLTGFTEVDKKLKSSYKSSITTRINNIVKLYEDGQLTAEEAEKYIKQLKAKSTSTGSGKSKKFKMTFKAAKYDIPKINIKFKKPTASTIKLKSAPKIKVTSSRKYTIKA